MLQQISPCTGPSPPIEFQSLCNVVVWGMPVNPNGEILRYEVQFYVPGTQLEVAKEIPHDRTFYIVEYADKLSLYGGTFVRVICSCLLQCIVLQKPYRSKDTDSMCTAYYLINIHAGQ